jgi:hypothetical protein
MTKFQSQYESAFLKAFEKLNPAQRQAVENIEGPVLVIAAHRTEYFVSPIRTQAESKCVQGFSISLGLLHTE